MKKKLYFEKKSNITKSYSIEIIDGKIRMIYGGLIMYSPILNVHNAEKEIQTKEDFTLNKVSKYDKKILGIDANYKIISSVTTVAINEFAYIKLSALEKFYIDFKKKETFLHEHEIKKMIIISLIITMPTSIMPTCITNYLSRQKENINDLTTIHFDNDTKFGNNK